MSIGKNESGALSNDKKYNVRDYSMRSSLCLTARSTSTSSFSKLSSVKSVEALNTTERIIKQSRRATNQNGFRCSIIFGALSYDKESIGRDYSKRALFNQTARSAHSYTTKTAKKIRDTESVHRDSSVQALCFQNERPIYAPNTVKHIGKRSRKATTKKGVRCSIIRSTSFKSERCINPTSHKNATNYEWQRSRYSDLKDFSPTYAANNLNTTLIRIKKHGLRRLSTETKMTRREREEEEEKDEKLALTTIISDRRKALPPNMNYLVTSHNLINIERVRRNILPLHRVQELDELATIQAKIMAAQQCRIHSCLNTVMPKILESGPCRTVGENVCRGTSVQFIQKKIMRSPKYESDKNNVLDRRFSSFGVGSAPDVDGILYICQIFKG